MFKRHAWLPVDSGRKATALSVVWAGIFEKDSNRAVRNDGTYGGMLPAFGNPARSNALTTSVGFAALVHTRCALIGSGGASNNLTAPEKTLQLQLSKRYQQCQALLFFNLIVTAGSCH